MKSARFDAVLVGGGLQNALLALAWMRARPQLRFALIERETRLGGNHTWSFHDSDLTAETRALVDPLVVARWPAHRVAFPTHTREMPGGYASISSQQLDAVVRPQLESHDGVSLMLGREAISVDEHSVELSDGTRVEGALVVDARGPERFPAEGTAFQKFVGLELRLAAPTEIRTPMLMDACVPQLDGFRFFYVLPFARDRILVEDTRYSDTSHLDVTAMEAGILEYARASGFDVADVVRREVGTLPLPLRDTRSEPMGASSRLTLGYQGGFVHPTTGYSLPIAARIACLLSRGDELGPFVVEHRRQARFFMLLNRLLFRALPPGERWGVLARFYRLPVDTIQRFYAMQLTLKDQLRILTGRPPRGMSLHAAITEGFLS